MRHAEYVWLSNVISYNEIYINIQLLMVAINGCYDDAIGSYSSKW